MELTLNHLKFVVTCQPPVGAVRRSGSTSQMLWHLSRDIKEVREWAIWLLGGDYFK